jgi:hypothetical protein
MTCYFKTTPIQTNCKKGLFWHMSTHTCYVVTLHPHDVPYLSTQSFRAVHGQAGKPDFFMLALIWKLSAFSAGQYDGINVMLITFLYSEKHVIENQSI